MFKSMVTDGDPSIFYFRKGSAASTLNAEDVAALDFSSYSAVHVTGITPALSETARKAVFALAKIAREQNLQFSFDPNLAGPSAHGPMHQFSGVPVRFVPAGCQ